MQEFLDFENFFVFGFEEILFFLGGVGFRKIFWISTEFFGFKQYILDLNRFFFGFQQNFWIFFNGHAR